MRIVMNISSIPERAGLPESVCTFMAAQLPDTTPAALTRPAARRNCPTPAKLGRHDDDVLLLVGLTLSMTHDT